jgi:sugar phosphate isomerase/epimerase
VVAELGVGCAGVSEQPFDELVLSVMTSPGASFVDRVEAAASAGYHGIGLRPGDRTRAHAAGLSDDDLRRLLDRHGVRVVEIDALVGWGAGDDARAKARIHEERIYELADALGAHHMTITGDLTGPWERSVELFGAVCDRAAPHELGVALEFLPWSDVPDADTARRLVHAAGRANGGVLVDSWHHFRGAASDDQLLALPPKLVMGVQFDDGLMSGEGTLLEQTHDRRLPGDGEFDLGHFLRLLWGNGVRLPLCVEVISPAMADRPAGDAARIAADRTRAVVDQAFGS